MADSLQVQKISKSWHEEMVTLEIEHPEMSLGEIARKLNVTQSHMSVVRNSDAFIEYRARRMREHQEYVSRGIVDRAQKVTRLGLEVMEERIKAEHETIGLGVVKDITEMTLKSLGYGPSPVSVSIDQSQHNNVTHVSKEDREAFDNARKKLRVVNEMNTKDVEDAEVVDSGNTGETTHPEAQGSGLLESRAEDGEAENSSADLFGRDRAGSVR